MNINTAFTLTLALVWTLAADTLTVSFGASGAFAILDSVRIEYPARDTIFRIDGGDSLRLITSPPISLSHRVSEIRRGAHPLQPFFVAPMRIGVHTVAEPSGRMQIFDTKGRLKVSSYAKSGDLGTLTISLSGLPDGLYTIVTQTHAQTQVSQLILLNRNTRPIWKTGGLTATVPWPCGVQRGAALSSPKSHPLHINPGDSLNFQGWAKGRSTFVRMSIDKDYHLVFTFQPQITVTTNEIRAIMATSALGRITTVADSGIKIVVRGVCYGTDSLPDTSGWHTIDSSSALPRSVTGLTGLAPSTTYYVRGYASSPESTFYGKPLSFTTDHDPVTLQVGDRYAGGWIGAFFRAGDPGFVPNEAHGLIVDTLDLGTFHWGCSTTVIGSTTTGIGSGLKNTEAIISKCSYTLGAAYQCAALERNGFSDWFLPSLDELGLLYFNRQSIGMAATNYWSSSDLSNVLYAWFIDFNSKIIKNNTEHKQKFTLSVRAVRYF